MIVKLDNIDQSAYVSSEIRKLFPNLKYLSHAEFTKGEYASLYQNMLILILGLALLVAILFGVLLIFLNKTYIKRRNKEFAILYSLGYEKRSIGLILLSEYSLISFFNYILAFGILKVVNEFFLKYTAFREITSNIFTLSTFCIGLIFVFIRLIIRISG